MRADKVSRSDASFLRSSFSAGEALSLMRPDGSKLRVRFSCYP